MKIANGNYKMREIAYCTDRELEEMDYLPVQENWELILDHLLQVAADNPHIEDEAKWEEYHKTPYQDNYYDECDGENYCVQHDIVTGIAILYRLG